jgi:hypothetical protein
VISLSLKKSKIREKKTNYFIEDFDVRDYDRAEMDWFDRKSP